MKRLQETQRAKIIWNLEHHLQDLREIFQALYGYSDFYSLDRLSYSSGEVYGQIESKFADLSTDASRLTSAERLVSLAGPLRSALESSKAENSSRLEISAWEMFERLIIRAETNLNAAAESVIKPNYRKDVDLYNLAMSALQDVALNHPDKLHKDHEVLIALEDKVNIAQPRPPHNCSPYDFNLLFYNLFIDAIEAAKKGVMRISFDYETPVKSAVAVTLTIPGAVMPEKFRDRTREAVRRKYGGRIEIKSAPVYRGIRGYRTPHETQVKIHIPYRT